MPNDLSEEIQFLKIKYSAHLCEGSDGKTSFTGFTLCVGGDILEVSIKDSQISELHINRKKSDINLYWKSAKVFTSRLFPFIFFEAHKEEDGSPDEIPYTGKYISKLLSYFVKIDNNKKNLTPSSILGRRTDQPIIPYIPRLSLSNVLKNRPNYIDGSVENTAKLNELADLLLITYFGQIIG